MLCNLCLANQALEPDDWTIVNFYRRVSGEYVNQTPMGCGEGKPPVLSFSLAGCLAALRIYDYPKRAWPILVDGAVLLHGLYRDQSEVDWHSEAGKPLREIGLDDVRSPSRSECVLPAGLVDLEV